MSSPEKDASVSRKAALPDGLLLQLNDASSLFTPVKALNRLRYTCLAVSSRYVALGANTGGLYIFSRSSVWEYLNIVPNRDGVGSMVSVAFSPNDNFVGMCFAKHVGVWELNLDGRNKPVRIKWTACEHQSPITCLAWDMYGARLFSGDERGLVTVTYLPPAKVSRKGNDACKNRPFRKDEIIYRADSGIVQLDFKDTTLLVSAKKSCFVLDTHQEVARQLGHKPRDGQFGGCLRILRKESGRGELLVYTARPGGRVWEAPVSEMKVSTTHKLKEVLQASPHTFFGTEYDPAVVLPAADLQSAALIFPSLHVICSRYLVLWNRTVLCVYDPNGEEKARLLHWCPFLDEISFVECYSNEVYIAHAGASKITHLTCSSPADAVALLYHHPAQLKLQAVELACRYLSVIKLGGCRRSVPLKLLDQLLDFYRLQSDQVLMLSLQQLREEAEEKEADDHTDGGYSVLPSGIVSVIPNSRSSSSRSSPYGMDNAGSRSSSVSSFSRMLDDRRESRTSSPVLQAAAGAIERVSSSASISRTDSPKFSFSKKLGRDGSTSSESINSVSGRAVDSPSLSDSGSRASTMSASTQSHRSTDVSPSKDVAASVVCESAAMNAVTENGSAAPEVQPGSGDTPGTVVANGVQGAHVAPAPTFNRESWAHAVVDECCDISDDNSDDLPSTVSSATPPPPSSGHAPGAIAQDNESSSVAESSTRQSPLTPVDTTPAPSAVPEQQSAIASSSACSAAAGPYTEASATSTLPIAVDTTDGPGKTNPECSPTVSNSEVASSSVDAAASPCSSLNADDHGELSTALPAEAAAVSGCASTAGVSATSSPATATAAESTAAVAVNTASSISRDSPSPTAALPAAATVSAQDTLLDRPSVSVGEPTSPPASPTITTPPVQESPDRQPVKERHTIVEDDVPFPEVERPPSPAVKRVTKKKRSKKKALSGPKEGGSSIPSSPKKKTKVSATASSTAEATMASAAVKPAETPTATSAPAASEATAEAVMVTATAAAAKTPAAVTLDTQVGPAAVAEPAPEPLPATVVAEVQSEVEQSATETSTAVATTTTKPSAGAMKPSSPAPERGNEKGQSTVTAQNDSNSSLPSQSSTSADSSVQCATLEPALEPNNTMQLQQQQPVSNMSVSSANAGQQRSPKVACDEAASPVLMEQPLPSAASLANRVDTITTSAAVQADKVQPSVTPAPASLPIVTSTAAATPAAIAQTPPTAQHVASTSEQPTREGSPNVAIPKDIPKDQVASTPPDMKHHHDQQQQQATKSRQQQGKAQLQQTKPQAQARVDKAVKSSQSDIATAKVSRSQSVTASRGSRSKKPVTTRSTSFMEITVDDDADTDVVVSRSTGARRANKKRKVSVDITFDEDASVGTQLPSLRPRPSSVSAPVSGSASPVPSLDHSLEFTRSSEASPINAQPLSFTSRTNSDEPTRQVVATSSPPVPGAASSTNAAPVVTPAVTPAVTPVVTPVVAAQTNSVAAPAVTGSSIPTTTTTTTIPTTGNAYSNSAAFNYSTSAPTSHTATSMPTQHITTSANATTSKPALQFLSKHSQSAKSFIRNMSTEVSQRLATPSNRPAVQALPANPREPVASPPRETSPPPVVETQRLPFVVDLCEELALTKRKLTLDALCNKTTLTRCLVKLYTRFRELSVDFARFCGREDDMVDVQLSFAQLCAQSMSQEELSATTPLFTLFAEVAVNSSGLVSEDEQLAAQSAVSTDSHNVDCESAVKLLWEVQPFLELNKLKPLLHRRGWSHHHLSWHFLVKDNLLDSYVEEIKSYLRHNNSRAVVSALDSIAVSCAQSLLPCISHLYSIHGQPVVSACVQLCAYVSPWEVAALTCPAAFFSQSAGDIATVGCCGRCRNQPNEWPHLLHYLNALQDKDVDLFNKHVLHDHALLMLWLEAALQQRPDDSKLFVEYEHVASSSSSSKSPGSEFNALPGSHLLQFPCSPTLSQVISTLVELSSAHCLKRALAMCKQHGYWLGVLHLLVVTQQQECAIRLLVQLDDDRLLGEQQRWPKCPAGKDEWQLVMSVFSASPLHSTFPHSLSWTGLIGKMVSECGSTAAMTVLQSIPAGADRIDPRHLAVVLASSKLEVQQQSLGQSVLEKVDMHLWSMHSGALAPALQCEAATELTQVLASRCDTDGEQPRATVRSPSQPRLRTPGLGDTLELKQTVRWLESASTHWGVSTSLVNSDCPCCSLPLSENMADMSQPLSVFACGHGFHRHCISEDACVLCYGLVTAPTASSLPSATSLPSPFFRPGH